MLNPRSLTLPMAGLALCFSLAAATTPTFEADVQPIFAAKCVMCHGAAPQGKLDLRTQQSVLNGGASGPAVLPGESAKSLLLTKVVTRQMPPGSAKLTDAEIDRIRIWIDKGLAPEAPVTVSENEVRAIFQVRCVLCHGSTDRKGGLDLRTLASRLKGGKSGPGLVPGKPEESLIYQRIVNGQMPPDKLAKDLAVELPTASETEKIRAWIAAGAPGPDGRRPTARRHREGYRPPVLALPAAPAARPSPPSKIRPWCATPSMPSCSQKLEAKGLRYARRGRSPRAPAPRLPRPHRHPALARRNRSLPPRHSRPTPTKALVDRLLASPRYGERWGQHWLDLAGYSDSEGFGQDDGVRPSAWRYRDYVIRSLNADKPYNQFLTEQIAGDELSDDWKKTKDAAVPEETIDRLAATGFLRTAPGPHRFQRARPHRRAHERASPTRWRCWLRSVMGLTVGCARCHNHKYDPIPQRDYYRLSAILQAAYDPYEWKAPKESRISISATEAERKTVTEKNAPLQAEIKRIQQQIDEAAEPFRKRRSTKPRRVTRRSPGRSSAAATCPPIKRNDAQRALAEKYKDAFDLSDQDLSRKYADFRTATQALQKDLATARGKLTPPPHVRVLTDNLEPSVSPTCCSAATRLASAIPSIRAFPPCSRTRALKPYAPVAALRRHQRTPPGPRQLAHPAQSSAHRARRRQSDLVAPLRPRHRRHRLQLRPLRRAAHSSRNCSIGSPPNSSRAAGA